MKLFDASALIEQLQRGFFERGAISVITLVEVLRGVPQEKRIKVKNLIEEAYDVLDIDNEVILKYCEIYTTLKRRGRAMPDADVLIAATAMARGLTLVTRDRDFERLIDLNLKLELKS